MYALNNIETISLIFVKKRRNFCTRIFLRFCWNFWQIKSFGVRFHPSWTPIPCATDWGQQFMSCFRVDGNDRRHGACPSLGSVVQFRDIFTLTRFYRAIWEASVDGGHCTRKLPCRLPCHSWVQTFRCVCFSNNVKPMLECPCGMPGYYRVTMWSTPVSCLPLQTDRAFHWSTPPANADTCCWLASRDSECDMTHCARQHRPWPGRFFC